MNPLQQLLELIGYPVVGASAKIAAKIGQEAQANILEKSEAIKQLQELKDAEAAHATQLPEHIKFLDAVSELITSIEQI